MSINADLNFQKVATTHFYKSKGNKKWRIHLTDSDERIALEGVKKFSKCPKASLKEKIFGKRYVVLKVQDGDQSAFVKVNKQSLVRRLSINSIIFNNELKNHKDRDMTQFVQGHIQRQINREYYANHPWEIEHASDEIKKDYSVGYAVVTASPLCLQFLDSTLQNHKYLVNTAINYDPMALQFASDELKNDFGIVNQAVQKNGEALKFASDERKDDPTVVLHSFYNKYGDSPLKYASDRLKNDKHIVMKAIESNPIALKYASPEMKNDRDVVMAAVSRDPKMIKYASKEMRKDPEVKALSKRNR